MSVDTTHAFFLAWIHETSQRVRFRKINLHFDLPGAVMGDISVWAGEVKCVFIMSQQSCPMGQLLLSVHIPELAKEHTVSFTCSASAVDLRRASAFLYDFSHQVSTPQQSNLPEVVMEDLTNVTLFPRATLGPWYVPYMADIDTTNPADSPEEKQSRKAEFIAMLATLPDYTPQRYQAAILPFQPVVPAVEQALPTGVRRWLLRASQLYATSSLFRNTVTALFVGVVLFSMGWLAYAHKEEMAVRQAVFLNVRSAYPGLRAYFSAEECAHDINDKFYILACHHQMVKRADQHGDGLLALQYLDQFAVEMGRKGYYD